MTLGGSKRYQLQQGISRNDNGVPTYVADRGPAVACGSSVVYCEEDWKQEEEFFWSESNLQEREKNLMIEAAIGAGAIIVGLVAKKVFKLKFRTPVYRDPAVGKPVKKK